MCICNSISFDMRQSMCAGRVNTSFCFRVVTLQTIMELVENPFTAVDFQMKISSLSM